MQVYLLGFLTIFSGIFVILSTNLIYSVLFLILIFCNISGILFFFGAEFISLLILIIYIGAISVLLIFVIMMLHLKSISSQLNFKTQFYFFVKLNLLIISLGYFLLLLSNQVNLNKICELFVNSFYTSAEIWSFNEWSNISTLGHFLYTHYAVLFLVSSIPLLASMIGVIFLTLHQRTHVKRQKINVQLTRVYNKAIKFNLN